MKDSRLMPFVEQFTSDNNNDTSNKLPSLLDKDWLKTFDSLPFTLVS
jgi:hypothetical protein